MAINSESESSDSEEDENLKAAKKAIYAKNYTRKHMVEDEFSSESEYWIFHPISPKNLSSTYII